MKVYKFGGVSVQDAEAVKNVAAILQDFDKKPLLVVISAMGKTTNALEKILDLAINNQDFEAALQETKNYHTNIFSQLLPNKNIAIWKETEDVFDEIRQKLANAARENNYDFLYDQVIGYGEILSTKIVSAYLSFSGYNHIWKDARELIFTDSLYREARVDFGKSNKAIQNKLLPLLNQNVVITQGFIGTAPDGSATTLGREGSDFSAAIFAAALDAEELIIWKNVDGILNADPNRFSGTVKFDTLSYQDAVEMTYYGASVLHQNTIKPVENKQIKVHVKSFLNPLAKGTYILPGAGTQTEIPVIIIKEKQVLLTISTKDLSFIAEENIRRIFEEVVRFGIKVNVMQNSAISFIICADEMGRKVTDFEQALQEEFTVTESAGKQLLTVKNANPEIVEQLVKDKNILLELRTPKTWQFVLDNK